METDKVIVVVDDNATNRKLVGVLLKGSRYKMVEFSEGMQALSYLAQHKVDLVLLDISMPVMSGIEVCHSIRAHAELCSLPVIAYTAHALAHEGKALLKEGFTDLLIKPITRERLFSVVERNL